MSVTIFINGHNDEQPADMLQLTFYVSNDVLGKLFEAMTPEERIYWQKNRGPEVLSPDGTDIFARTGTINFYLLGVPERLYKLVEWHLTDKLHDCHFPYGKSFFDKSKMFGCDTLRVPEIQLPDGDPAPVMSITTSSAGILMRVLGFNHLFNGYGFDNIPVADLIVRASELIFNEKDSIPTTSTKAPGGPQVISMGYDLERLNDLRDGILNLAKWAHNHGYETLTIA